MNDPTLQLTVHPNGRPSKWNVFTSSFMAGMRCDPGKDPAGLATTRARR
jgi:hypothetical protein